MTLIKMKTREAFRFGVGTGWLIGLLMSAYILLLCGCGTSNHAKHLPFAPQKSHYNNIEKAKPSQYTIQKR